MTHVKLSEMGRRYAKSWGRELEDMFEALNAAITESSREERREFLLAAIASELNGLTAAVTRFRKDVLEELGQIRAVVDPAERQRRADEEKQRADWLAWYDGVCVGIDDWSDSRSGWPEGFRAELVYHMKKSAMQYESRERMAKEWERLMAAETAEEAIDAAQILRGVGVGKQRRWREFLKQQEGVT